MGAGASSLGRPVYHCHACSHKFFPEDVTTTTNAPLVADEEEEDGSNNDNDQDGEVEGTADPPDACTTCPRCGSDFLELGRAISSDVGDVVRAAAANGIPRGGWCAHKEGVCRLGKKMVQQTKEYNNIPSLDTTLLTIPLPRRERKLRSSISMHSTL